jgi:hypothetical protein
MSVIINNESNPIRDKIINRSLDLLRNKEHIRDDGSRENKLLPINFIKNDGFHDMVIYKDFEKYSPLPFPPTIGEYIKSIFGDKIDDNIIKDIWNRYRVEFLSRTQTV